STCMKNHTQVAEKCTRGAWMCRCEAARRGVAGSHPRHLAVPQRRMIRNLAEGAAELHQRAEADLFRDRTHLVIGLLQQPLCFLDADKVDVRDESETCNLLEHPAQISRAELELPSQFLQTDRFGVMRVDVTDDGRYFVMK